MDFFKQTVNIFIDIFTALIFLRVILSWMVRDKGVLIDYLTQATEPLLGPIRRAIPSIGGFDLSPLIAFVLLDVIRILFNTYL